MTFSFEGQLPQNNGRLGSRYIFIFLCVGTHFVTEHFHSGALQQTFSLMSYPKSHGNWCALAQSRMLCNAHIQACDDFEASKRSPNITKKVILSALGVA